MRNTFLYGLAILVMSCASLSCDSTTQKRRHAVVKTAQEIERIALHPELVPRLKRESVEYVKRHHDYIKVAQQYLDFYSKL